MDRFVALRVAGPLYRSGILRSAPGIPVLMYHSVSDEQEAGVSPYLKLCTPAAIFSQHMRLLQGSGYKAVDMAEAARRLQSGQDVAQPCVAITFDDGLRNFRSQAWPVLRQYGFTATVYLPTGLIGETAPRKLFERDCLTWRDVTELHREGVGFGSHTVTHPRLSSLPWAQAMAELQDSRKAIEDRLNMEVEDFSHPFAYPEADRDYCRRFRDALTESGYRRCVTTRIGRLHAKDDPLCIPRLPVNGADDSRLFGAKLAGHYDCLGRLQRQHKRLRRLLHPAPARNRALGAATP